MQIDLEPTAYRRGPLRADPLANKVFMRAAVGAAVWFAICVGFGRLAHHGLPWYLIAAPALAPGLLLAYIAIGLDD